MEAVSGRSGASSGGTSRPDTLKGGRPLDPLETERVRRARQGDRAAQAELFADNYQYVAKALFRLTANQLEDDDGAHLPKSVLREIAEDLAISGIADAVTSYDPEKGARFSTWAVWNGRSRMRKVLEEALRVQLGGGDVEQVQTRFVGPEEAAVDSAWRRQIRYQIDSVLGAIGVEHARLLIASYEGGRNKGRIQRLAEQEGCSRDEMYRRLRIARRKFIQEWTKRYGPFPS